MARETEKESVGVFLGNLIFKHLFYFLFLDHLIQSLRVLNEDNIVK